MAMKIENLLTVYEVNGTEVDSSPDAARLAVRSHWNRNRLVVLEIAGQVVTVAADDLERALINATNWSH